MKRAVVLVLVLLFLATPAHACYRGHPRNVPLKAAKNVSRVLHHWFGKAAHDAQSVVSCESRYDKRARNGSGHVGLFQMGEWERQNYGHGLKVWWQVRAAHRYWVASGRDWSPWVCEP